MNPPEAEASDEREARGGEEPLKLCSLSLLMAILFFSALLGKGVVCHTADPEGGDHIHRTAPGGCTVSLECTLSLPR